MTEYKAYCVKCREKGVTIKNPKAVQIKTGNWTVQGEHETCGTKLTRIVGKNKPTAL